MSELRPPAMNLHAGLTEAALQQLTGTEVQLQ